MIVFSATHSPTARAFVGSCRVDLDFHWAMLIAQAEEGVSGPFFELLRQDGADSFDVAEYAQAESARELTELTRDALDELSAEPIKSTQAQRPVRSVKVDDALLSEDDQSDPDDDVEAWMADRKAQAPAQVQPQPVAEPVARVETAQRPLRDTRSTEQAASMRSLIAGIEARRQSQRKSPPKKPAAGIRKPAAVATASRAESAASKERRIKAALAEQKAARDAEKQRLVADQADEMAQILARLDARTKVADSIRRKR